MNVLQARLSARLAMCATHNCLTTDRPDLPAHPIPDGLLISARKSKPLTMRFSLESVNSINVPNVVVVVPTF